MSVKWRENHFEDHGEECVYPEDGWFFSQHFVFMGDGCSECYSGTPFLYPGKKSGGQMVVEAIKQTFALAVRNDQLEDVVLRANEEVWNVQRQHRGDAVSREDAATLANASFTCVKLGGDSRSAEVICGADCFTIWQTESGKVGMVGGDNRAVDLMREEIYANTPDKKEYWLEKFPRLRRGQDNVLHAVLNGQRGNRVQKLWHREVIEEPIVKMVLLTDGAWVPMELWGYNLSMAKIFMRFLREGLPEAMAWVREVQSDGPPNKRVAKPEATALLLWPE